MKTRLKNVLLRQQVTAVGAPPQCFTERFVPCRGLWLAAAGEPPDCSSVTRTLTLNERGVWAPCTLARFGASPAADVTA